MNLEGITRRNRKFHILISFISFIFRSIILLGIGCWMGFCICIEFCRPYIPGAIPNNSKSAKLIRKYLQIPTKLELQEAEKKRKQQGRAHNQKRKEEQKVTLSKQGYGLTYGKETAPHHIVNFFDIGCTHCATFFKETWPIIRRVFVDTGKLRITFIPYPIHTETLIFMTCAEQLIPALQQILFEVLMESDLSKISAVTVMEQCMETFHKTVTQPSPETLKEALVLTQKHEFIALPMMSLDGKLLSDAEQDDIINFLDKAVK